ncbi:DUF192 domain-containing protein [Rheinheimera sp.]|uniref:DUF192 domain-containing protein n=1 Tax=Rheinheimera sp. TaxID=1869214 RepID=UPI003D2BB855
MRLVSWLCVLPLLGCQVDVSKAEVPVFPLIPLQAGSQTLQVQLADTVERRMRGLMEQAPVRHGMLLLYETPRTMTLWMKNTPTALDVAFINPNWQISKIQPMAANSEDLHESPGDVIAALEMPLGWFAANGVKVGHKISSCQALPVSCPSGK